MTDGFVFYGSFMKALATLPDDDRLKAYDAICRYALYDEEPTCDGAALGMFYMAQPQIDANRKRRENGKNGGRPKTEREPAENQTETKEEPKDNLTETNGEPKEKVKDKDKVKEKEKDKKEREVRHRYGEFQHVLLTDKQYADLLDKYGDELLAAGIKRVDEYCEETGKGYKNYALVIQRWGVRASPTTKREDYFTAGRHENDGTAEAKAKVIEMAARGLL